MKGHVDIVKYLVSIGANTEEREMRAGRTALHLAVEYKQRNVIRTLACECKAQLEATSWSRYTPYHVAYEFDTKLAQDLQRLGAIPSLPPSFESDEDDYSSDDYDEDDDDEDDENDNINDQCPIDSLKIGSNIPSVVPTSS